MLCDKELLKHHLKRLELKIVSSHFSASQQGLHLQRIAVLIGCVQAPAPLLSHKRRTRSPMSVKLLNLIIKSTKEGGGV